MSPQKLPDALPPALAVTPREARRLLSVGNTHLYKLIGAGELESYRDGRARRITMESIRQRIARLLAANGINSTTAVPGKRKRGRPRKVCSTQGSK
jgi:excisionase family DNA binding protein